jgi:hypothetical protein
MVILTISDCGWLDSELEPSLVFSSISEAHEFAKSITEGVLTINLGP